MLTLTRKLGQRILVGDDVVVEVISISGGLVKLGVRAPRRVAVHRGELLEDAAAENRAAPRPRDARNEEDRIRDATRVLHFERGLYGFEHAKEWVLCELAEDLPVLRGREGRVLVARCDPALRLVVLDLEWLVPDYPLERAAAAAELSDESLAYAVIVRVDTEGNHASANLAAPLVIGLSSLRGRQVLLEGLPLAASFDEPIEHEATEADPGRLAERDPADDPCDVTVSSNQDGPTDGASSVEITSMGETERRP